MRPLVHPEIDDLTVEALLHALSDPVRVSILSGIVEQDCSHACSTFSMVNDKPIPKSTLSQHFRILREAGLIRGERRGVEMHNVSRCNEVDARFPGLIGAVVRAYGIQQATTPRKGRRSRPRPPKKRET